MDLDILPPSGDTEEKAERYKGRFTERRNSDCVCRAFQTDIASDLATAEYNGRIMGE